MSGDFTTHKLLMQEFSYCNCELVETEHIAKKISCKLFGLTLCLSTLCFCVFCVCVYAECTGLQALGQ